MGYTVTFKTRKDSPYEKLPEYDQLWVLSSFKALVKDSSISDIINVNDYKNIKSFIESGNGVYIAADNYPHLKEADYLLEKFMDSGISYVESENSKMRILSQSSFSKNKLTAMEHELFTGLSTMHEGHTVSRIEESSYLDVIAVGTRGNLICLPKDHNQNVVYDSGYTKLYGGKEDPKFIRNLALYLSGYRREDIKRESTNYPESKN